MATNVSTVTFEQWLALPESERARLIQTWNPYEGEGQDILSRVCDRFAQQFAGQPGVEDVHCGVYHGGTYVVGVTVRKGSRVRVPRSFEGFPVVKLST